jgi:hypothetical protein
MQQKIIKSYSIDTSKIFGKSVIIWGEIQIIEENGHTYYEHYPLIFLRKPKNLAQKSFDEIIKRIELNIPKDMEIKDAF